MQCKENRTWTTYKIYSVSGRAYTNINTNAQQAHNVYIGKGAYIDSTIQPHSPLCNKLFAFRCGCALHSIEQRKFDMNRIKIKLNELIAKREHIFTLCLTFSTLSLSASASVFAMTIKFKLSTTKHFVFQYGICNTHTHNYCEFRNGGKRAIIERKNEFVVLTHFPLQCK